MPRISVGMVNDRVRISVDGFGCGFVLENFEPLNPSGAPFYAENPSECSIIMKKMRGNIRANRARLWLLLNYWENFCKAGMGGATGSK